MEIIRKNLEETVLNTSAMTARSKPEAFSDYILDKDFVMFTDYLNEALVKVILGIGVFLSEPPTVDENGLIPFKFKAEHSEQVEVVVKHYIESFIANTMVAQYYLQKGFDETLIYQNTADTIMQVVKTTLNNSVKKPRQCLYY